MFGGTIYAEVTLKGPSGSSIVKIEGTIPYEAEVSPQLTRMAPIRGPVSDPVPHRWGGGVSVLHNPTAR